MKKSTKCISVILSVILILSAVTTSYFAETVYEHDGLLYTKLNDDFVSVYGFEGDYTDIVIPDSVDEGYVYEISAFAMQNNTDITSLDLSKASHLNTLGTMCFNGCTSLTGGLYVPYLVTDVRMGAFQKCSSLESVDYSAHSASVPEVCFNRCSSLKKVTILDYVSSIEKLAFANCPNLNEVYIPDSVTDIHYTAFSNDEDLVIYCYSGSYAQRFAVQYGYDFVLIDTPEPTEPPTEPETIVPTEPTPTDTPTDAPTEPVTEAPTDVPTQPATELAGYYLGDVNGDGEATVIDATIIQRYLANLPYPDDCVLTHGDVDGDGAITIIDVTCILRYEAQLYVPYPVGEWTN